MQTSVKNQFNHEIPLVTDKKYEYDYDTIHLKWSQHCDQISPSAGGLPPKRIERKCQQLENFLHVFNTQIYSRYKKENQDKKYTLTLVDFCSGNHYSFFNLKNN